MPDLPRLYDDLAKLWPHLTPPAEYAAEAGVVRDLIAQSLGEPATGTRWSVLELGAGGGHGIYHLKHAFNCTAADLSPKMLAYCEKLNPGVPTIVGDMRQMRLDQKFDAVLIHDAVDYMLTEHDMRQACATAAAHLRPGGVAIIAPTYTTETFPDGDYACDTADLSPQAEQSLGLCGLTYSTYIHDPDPADTTFEMVLLYLIRDATSRQVKVVEDRHTCGLFSVEQWCDAMEAAGLETDPLLSPPADEDPDDLSGWSTVFLGIKR